MSSLERRSFNLSEGLKNQSSFKPHLDSYVLCLHIAMDLVKLLDYNLPQLDYNLLTSSQYVGTCSKDQWS